MGGLLDLMAPDPNLRRGGLLSPIGWDKNEDWHFTYPKIAIDAAKTFDNLGKAQRLPHGTSPDHPAYKSVFDAAGAINLPSLLRKGSANTVGMNLWHGGPNKWAAEPGFPQGRPRLDKMGEGEGVQAFGKGFYSAEKPAVALDYKRRLSRKPAEITYDGKPINADVNVSGSSRKFTDFTSKEGLVNEIFMRAKTEGVDPSVILNQRLDGSIKKIDRVENSSMSMSSQIPQLQKLDDHIKLLKSIDPKLIKKIDPDDMIEGGVLYKLDIPDEDIAKYIDLDAPLSEQSQYIKDALQKIKGQLPENAFDDLGGNWDALFGPNVTGQQLIGTIDSIMGGKFAEKVLRKAGIPGNRYADQMSRGKNAQTRNYVTWDQKVLDRAKVLQRNEEIYKQLEKSGVPFA